MGKEGQETQSQHERIIELEKQITDLNQAYQMVIIKFINYVQAVEASTTLVKDSLRNLLPNNIK